jgi:flagellar export protein FliJ
MAFQFSLAAVLLVRQNAKKREEQALQKIQLEIARIVNQLEELNAEIAKTHDARERAMQQLIPAAHLHSFLQRVQAIVEAKKMHLQRLQVLELERERQLKVYQAAHRDLETIVEMFNEQREAHDQEQDRTEQKSLDDIFVARHQRN